MSAPLSATVMGSVSTLSDEMRTRLKCVHSTDPATRGKALLRHNCISTSSVSETRCVSYVPAGLSWNFGPATNRCCYTICANLLCLNKAWELSVNDLNSARKLSMHCSEYVSAYIQC